MRLVTVRTEDGTQAGRVDDDRIVLLSAPDVGALIADDPQWQATASTASGREVALDTADLAPVVPRPPKIICLGLNYLRHVLEMGRDVPPHPTIFAKYTSALIGPSDDIIIPAVSEAVDWEVELAVVIGTPGRHIPTGRALDHVGGYTVANDVSARDWQRRTNQFLQGKTFEGTTPVGPWMTTRDELPAGATGLEVSCEVNGVTMQRDNTAELLFGVADIVSYLSSIFTLEPGDLVLTGTPEGVGSGRTPPVYLSDGDVVRTAVEGIGELVNHCRRETVPAS